MGNVANLRNRQVKGNGKVKFLDKIYIIDIDEKMIDSLMKYFQWETNVELCCCDIESFLKDHIEKIDGVTSAANSFGIMDGGLDKALVDFFGEQLQSNVQRVIQKEFLGEQPVGTCLTIDIPGYSKKILHTPTMRIPQPILDPRIIYTATRSTLVEAIKNQIFTITLPAFGHLTGNVKSEIVAQYMRMAYDDVKKTLQETSSINTWEFVYENKNIDGILFKSYFSGNSPHNKQ